MIQVSQNPQEFYVKNVTFEKDGRSVVFELLNKNYNRYGIVTVPRDLLVKVRAFGKVIITSMEVRAEEVSVYPCDTLILPEEYEGKVQYTGEVYGLEAVQLWGKKDVPKSDFVSFKFVETATSLKGQVTFHKAQTLSVWDDATGEKFDISAGEYEPCASEQLYIPAGAVIDWGPNKPTQKEKEMSEAQEVQINEVQGPFMGELETSMLPLYAAHAMQAFITANPKEPPQIIAKMAWDVAIHMDLEEQDRLKGSDKEEPEEV